MRAQCALTSPVKPKRYFASRRMADQGAEVGYDRPAASGRRWTGTMSFRCPGRTRRGGGEPEEGSPEGRGGRSRLIGTAPRKALKETLRSSLEPGGHGRPQGWLARWRVPA